MFNTKLRYGVDHLGGTYREMKNKNSDILKKRELAIKKRNELRSCIKDLYDGGATYLQIAEELDIPESAVRSILK